MRSTVPWEYGLWYWSWQFTRTVQFHSNGRPLRAMTSSAQKIVHLLSNRPLLRNRPLQYFQTVHFGPDSSTNLSIRSFLGAPRTEIKQYRRYRTQEYKFKHGVPTFLQAHRKKVTKYEE